MKDNNIDDDAIFKALQEMIKADINKYPGYIINDAGDVIYNTANKNKQSIKELEALYDEYKDGAEYIKAVEKFNTIYNDDFINYSMQSYLTDNLNFPFNIMLSFIDTYFVYQKLKNNNVIVAEKKKTKLKCNKIKPASIYTKNASYIELGIKKYKKLDDTTKKEVLSVVYHTIKDADIVDNIDKHNLDYIMEIAKMNDISLDDAELFAEIDKEFMNKDKYNFN